MAHRVGVIGLGTVGSRFVDQFNSHGAFELVAAWDIDPEACTAHKNKVRIALDADAVIAESDLIYVAVPPLHHAQYVLDALKAGTAVFCEKPLGQNENEISECFDLAKQNNLKLFIAYQKRYDDNYRTL